MIVAWGNMMRRVVDEFIQQHVTLQEEIEFTQTYLDIQAVCFSDRLHLSSDVPGDLHSSQVPSFILQLLVANGFEYGIAKLAHGGTIEISASGSEGMLRLNVCNDGPWVLPMWKATRLEVNTSDVRTRLQALL